jgi:hypothetical protein
MKKKTRKQKRDERAESVCREVRYQMVEHGGIADNKKLFDLLQTWMRVANKNKYQRP